MSILKQDKRNAETLDAFEKALFAVCLDDWEEYTYAGHVRQILHGNGSNRVYDKNFQLIVMPSGRVVSAPPPPCHSILNDPPFPGYERRAHTFRCPRPCPHDRIRGGAHAVLELR